MIERMTGELSDEWLAHHYTRDLARTVVKPEIVARFALLLQACRVSTDAAVAGAIARYMDACELAKLFGVISQLPWEDVR